jgi:heptosyltransferase-3
MRLAILHAGALGDLVLAMYVVEHLRGYEIVLIARSELARWFVGRTSVTEAFDFDGPRVHTLFVEGGPVDAEITEALAMCDRIVSFCGRGPSVLVQQLRSVCPNRVDAIDPTVRSETIRAHRHITQQWADDLQQPLDLSVDLRSPLLHVHDDDVRFGEQRWQAMAATAGRRVLVHPGSGGRAKCWPIERFEALVDCLREAGWMVAWLIGPTEHEMFGP